jgi:hypothetical protein
MLTKPNASLNGGDTPHLSDLPSSTASAAGNDLAALCQFNRRSLLKGTVATLLTAGAMGRATAGGALQQGNALWIGDDRLQPVWPALGSKFSVGLDGDILPLWREVITPALNAQHGSITGETLADVAFCVRELSRASGWQLRIQDLQGNPIPAALCPSELYPLSSPVQWSLQPLAAIAQTRGA